MSELAGAGVHTVGPAYRGRVGIGVPDPLILAERVYPP